jgi:molecular chaperone GrpE
MAENEKKKPKKLDISDILDEAEPGRSDSGEIELLDPGTGAPMSDDAPRGDAGSTTSGPDAAVALAEREKYYDLWVRARADFENLKKRIDRERDEERTQAGAALVKDLLPVLDNLERALAGVAPGDPFRDGVALIARQLAEALQRAGLATIDALGTTFNPLYHDAVVTERTSRFEPNRVLEEFQKGYTFRGRVVRPALVRVAVKPDAETGERGSGGDGTSGDA